MRAMILAVLLIVGGGCSRGPEANAQALTGGNRDRGRTAVLTYGCHGCHDIPDVPGGQGAVVGPPLGGVGKRTYLAGRIPNNAETMVRYIQSPQSVDPKTVMPNLGIPEQDARDIAAFLYTLK